MDISKKTAQELACTAQGLRQKTPYGKGKNAAQKALQALSYVQIDTISVVQRAHHHTLWIRVPDYQLTWLNDLVKERQAFEYWSHAAAYLPMIDFRFSLPRKHDLKNGGKHWFAKDPKMEAYVLDRIKAEGPLMAKDFKKPPPKKGSAWGNWKPAKIAMEQRFMEGDLMITERRGFQKVFDLTERVLPSAVNTTLPTTAEFAQHLIFRTIAAQGLATLEQMVYLRRGIKGEVKKQLALLVEDKQLLVLNLEGVAKPYYTTPKQLEALPKRNMTTKQKQVHILNPFDNLIIQRQRLKDIFDYPDYVFECYVPKVKRKFGYFNHCITYGNQIVGMVDAKADRKAKVFHVLNLRTEVADKDKADFEAKWEAKLAEWKVFNGGELV